MSPNVKIGPRGVGKPGFPIPPPGERVWEGVALPRIIFIPSVCGGAAGTAEVNMGGSGSPRPPFASAQPARRGMRKPGFPVSSPGGGLGRAQPARRGMRKPGFPISSSGGRARPARRGMRKPGFPVSSPGGGLGRARPMRRGMGKPGFPRFSFSERVWEDGALPGKQPGVWGQPQRRCHRPVWTSQGYVTVVRPATEAAGEPLRSPPARARQATQVAFAPGAEAFTPTARTINRTLT